MKRHQPLRKDRRGVALLVALGVLVVLALLGSVFATMSGIERSVARNYIDKVRARFLAESGIEHAVAQLWQPDSMDMWRVDREVKWTYNGGDRNGNGIMDPGDIDKNGDGYPDREDLPITEALAPSFPVIDPGDGLPKLIQVGDRQIGYSGQVQVGTYTETGNIYSIRVRDLGSKLNVNTLHPNMKRILYNLFTAIKLADAQVQANKIVDSRPPQGYTDPNHLRAVVGRTVYDQIKAYVTTIGWVDNREVAEPRRTTRPVPFSNGYRRRDLTIGSDVFARWEMRPTLKYDEAADGPGVHGPRTPVNINEAPIEVLVAILQDLKGIYLYEDKYTTHTYDWYGYTAMYDGSIAPGTRVTRSYKGVSKDGRINGRIGTLYETTPIPAGTRPTAGSTTIPNGDGAWGIAHAIITERDLTFQNPPGVTMSGISPKTRNLFRNMQQFNLFVDQKLDPKLFRPIPGWDAPAWTLPMPKAVADDYNARGFRDWKGNDFVANEVPMVKDVIKANFNPNSHFSSLNPNEQLGTWIDKANLTYHTTEISFFPMGYFEIQSGGWVLDLQRRIIAEELVTVDIKLFETYRDTTQWDFMREWAVDGIPLSNVFSGAGGTTTGASLCSYPEYQIREFLKDPAYSHEGYLALNTVNTPLGQETKLAVRFDHGDEDTSAAGLTKAFHSAAPVAPNIPEEMAIGGSRQTMGPWADRLLGGKLPGSAANDGLICELGTSPGYINNNFNQHTGTISMWVKPGFRPENTGRQRVFASCYYYQVDADKACGSGHLSALHNLPGPEWLMCPFGIYYTAQHCDGPYAKDAQLSGSPADLYKENRTNVGYNQYGTTWPERSVGAGFGGRWCRDEFNGGIISPTVNHVGHDHTQCNGWGNYGMAQRWMHVGFVWKDTLSIENGYCRLYINGNCVGEQFGGTFRFSCGASYMWDKGNPYSPSGAGPNTRWGPLTQEVIEYANLRFQSFADSGTWNTDTDKQNYLNDNKIENSQGTEPYPYIRIGAEAAPPVGGATLHADTIMASRCNPPRPICNYTADSTIDEFVHTWVDDDTFIQNAWRTGRYVKDNGAVFTSPKVDLGPASMASRTLPLPGTATPPGGATPLPVPTAAPSNPTRLAFIAYTAYWPVNLPNLVPSGEYYDPEKQDLHLTTVSIAVTDPNSPTTEWMPMQRVPLGGTAVTTNANYTGDPANNPGTAVEVPTRQFRYKIRIDSNFQDANKPLLVSPILDDVTVAYYDRFPTFHSWMVGEE